MHQKYRGKYGKITTKWEYICLFSYNVSPCKKHNNVNQRYKYMLPTLICPELSRQPMPITRQPPPTPKNCLWACNFLQNLAGLPLQLFWDLAVRSCILTLFNDCLDKTLTFSPLNWAFLFDSSLHQKIQNNKILQNY
jgi:hypothetical protein